jgi:hypothetical protein
MRRHTSEEIARFFAPIAEASSTWARYRLEPEVEGELVHMADGDGERFRDDTRAGQLRCLLPACANLLTVAAGNKNRHHWRHRSAPSIAHSAETLWHLTAKAALVAFARERQPSATIYQDERYTDSRNKPDVWVRWKAADEVAGDVAFEAQFSTLDPRESGAAKRQIRRRRHRASVAVRAPGYAGDHPVRTASRSTGRGETAARAPGRIRRGSALRWVNPERRLVATAYVEVAERPDVHCGEVWHTDLKLIMVVRQHSLRRYG